MSGFPNRPTRNDFGPTYENERPVQDPKREVGEDIYNLNFWQVAGLGLVAPKVIIVATVAGSVVTTVNQFLAFDPSRSLSALTWTYEGVGHYSFDFQSQYPDEVGNNVNLSLVAGGAFVQGSTPLMSSLDLTSGYEGDLYFEDDAGAATNPSKFMMVIW